MTAALLNIGMQQAPCFGEDAAFDIEAVVPRMTSFGSRVSVIPAAAVGFAV